MNKPESNKDSLSYRLERIRLKAGNLFIEGVIKVVYGGCLVLPLPDDPEEARQIGRLDGLLNDFDRGKPPSLEEGRYELHPIPVETCADWLPADRKLQRIEQQTGRRVVGLTPFTDNKTRLPRSEWANVLLSTSEERTKEQTG